MLAKPKTMKAIAIVVVGYFVVLPFTVCIAVVAPQSEHSRCFD